MSKVTMQTKISLVLLGLATLATKINAECPNACSGHGDCGAFDMCQCWRNWQAADCSERTCAFGLAHVDTPKGDLNHDNTISTSTIIANDYVYKKGTEEKFPSMKDSYNNVLTNTAHYYMECSNKGVCDRGSGDCECFEGYEGSACQRASCPNKCSGHGTCESIRELAGNDNDNIYQLWDKDITYGCECDAGYYGADCSLRYCKYGVDPLYYDDEATYRVSEWNFETYSTADTVSGTYAVKFYDSFDKEWITEPIKADASCADFTSALYSLPNTVIPSGSLVCTLTDSSATAGDTVTMGYNVVFKQNPGYLKTPKIDAYLDGARTTLTDSTTAANAIVSRVYSGPMSGENDDYFYNRCEGVTVTITDTATPGDGDSLGGVSTLTGMTSDEITLLKKCLGDSNGKLDDNVEIYNWDKGASSFTNSAAATQYSVGMYPHAIKLVPKSPTQEYEGGQFYLTYFDETAFQVMSKIGSFGGTAYTAASTEFYVYTTDATVKMIYKEAGGTANVYDPADDLPVFAYFEQYSNTVYTSLDVSCENKAAQATNSISLPTCLQKGDYVFIPDGAYGDTKDVAYGVTNRAVASTAYTNHMFKIEKISVKSFSSSTSTTEDRYQIVLDKPIPYVGTTKNAETGMTTHGKVQLFKFEISENADGTAATSYNYVSQCSNRGMCNSDTATCECFKGYAKDSCDTQNAFAL